MKRKKQKPLIRTPFSDDDPRLRNKDNELRICTWNVRTLFRPGASIQLMKNVMKYNADVIALQEMRWTGQGCAKHSSCDIYYSCHETKHEFGVGFAVGKRLKHLVLRFTPVDDRLAILRIKARFHNLSLICVHAPTNEKDDEVKEAFYNRLEEAYERCPRHDIKIVLGDFNARVGKEGIFGPTVGKFSLHEETSDNGMRLIDFAAARNMVVSSTRFQHPNIHKATWLSPDQLTRSQIDHVAIDGRHASSVLDVRTIRGANIDSDHYLVAAKVRTRLCVAKRSRQLTQMKLDVEKLQSQQIARRFANNLSLQLNNSTPQNDDVNTQWNSISHCLRTTAEQVVGFHRPQRNTWYDEECRLATVEKDAAYRNTLRPAATRAMTERYREKRREERRLFRRKKRETERRECEEIEMLGDRNNTRKFFQNVKRQTEGFKNGAGSCRDENGNLVTDVQSILGLWRNHFSHLLCGESVNTEVESEAPVTDDGIVVPPPDLNEVRIAMARLKNKKAAGADGLPAELFKAGGEVLERRMHQLLCKIWSDECMPSDWNLSVLCPIYKKGDPTICANYRGISLISIAYKVLSSVLCERLKPIVNKLIGPYQCGFRPGKSTIDQIFTIRQILEKTQEKNIDTHHLFVDFKAAFDSTDRNRLYTTMSDFGIPAKLIRLCSMTLSATKSSVRIGKDLSEPFDTKRGFRQGDSLSCDFFNLILEKIIRNAELNRQGTIFYKSVMLLAYADDIDIVGHNTRAVSSAYSRLEREAAKVGLTVNEDKTKYLLSTTKESSRLGQSVTVGDRSFEVVKDFVYLGTSINTINDVSLEIKRRITLANRCYFGLSRQLRSRTLSRRTKLTLYKSLIIPVLLYGAEAWTLTNNDENILGAFERKVLRKIFGPLRVGDEYRIRWNSELYEMYRDVDIVKRIKIQRLRWLGHVSRMSEETPAKQIFETVPQGGKRRRGRPHLRWKDQVLHNLSTLEISNWRQQAQNRSTWRAVLDSAKTDTRL